MTTRSGNVRVGAGTVHAVVLALIGTGAACATPPAPPPAPSPIPATSPVPPAPPRTSPPPATRDSARVVTAESTNARRPADRTATRSGQPRPAPAYAVADASTVRRSARNDSITPRTLRGPFRLCAGGDVTLGTNLSPAWATEASRRMRIDYHLSDEPRALLAPLAPLVADADIVVLNVEGAIGAGPTPSKCGRRSTHCFAFRSPPSSARALRSLAPGIVVGNIANNHAHDAGSAGHDSTVAALARAGVLVTGNDTLATPVPTPAGDTIGILGFYTSSDTPDARDTAAVHRHVARAAARYPVVVATMHLGAEGLEAQRTRDQSERFLGIDRGNPVAFADAAVRGGAALVIGHGPHVLRAMEWRVGGALIAYSLGNLLTYGPFVLKEPLDRGVVMCATVDRSGRAARATLASTVQRAPGVLAPDPARRAAALVDSLSWLDFPRSGARTDSLGGVYPRGP